MKWSRCIDVFDSSDHRDIYRTPGVYRIRAFGANGKPLPIKRFAAIDYEGILHIGKSKRLGLRIRTFRQAAQGLRGAHQAGREYRLWKFGRKIPSKSLRYDYFITSNEREALVLERALHKEYRLKFLDRPPLDGTSGQETE